MPVRSLVVWLLLASRCAEAPEATPPPQQLAPTPSRTSSTPSGSQQVSVLQPDKLLFLNASSSGPTPASGDHAGTSDMFALIKPFIVRSATIRGPVSAELQAELEAEESAPPPSSSSSSAFRSLLHGTKKPKQYPKCTRCRMLRCNARGTYCSGHCRQKKKLFFCDTNGVPVFRCPPTSPDKEPTIEDFEDEPPGSIEEYDTVVVTATAPNIGCADIANRASGCPARGTRATLPDGRPGSVVASFCRAERYVPDCLSPLLPFGACECYYRPRGGTFSPRQIVRAPCSTTALAAGSGVGGADGSPSSDDITVRRTQQPNGGEVTETWYSNFTELGQEPSYEYALTATVRSIDVDVSMAIYEGLVLFSDTLQAGSEIADDYTDDYVADPEGTAEDYYQEVLERDYDDN